MTQVYTPESSVVVVVVALPPEVVTDEEITLIPPTEPPLARRVLRLLDWVWEVSVYEAASVLADPVVVTDPETMLSIETAP